MHPHLIPVECAYFSNRTPAKEIVYACDFRSKQFV